MLDTTSSAKRQTLIGLGGLDSPSAPIHRLIRAGQASQKVVKIVPIRPNFAELAKSPISF